METLTDDVGKLSALFRASMRRLAASVAIVVAKGETGPVGIAATSLSSLTIDPPTVLVCVNRATRLHPLLVPGAPLSINLLGRAHRDVSHAFGGGVAHDERFMVGDWRQGDDDLPLLAEAQANLRCVIDTTLAYGTHSIVIAKVRRVDMSGEVDPLIYSDGSYL